MYLTEEEAKKKWCSEVDDRLANGIDISNTCLASKCMKWRTGAHRNGCTATKCYKGCGYGKGYCGLAGKPE